MPQPNVNNGARWSRIATERQVRLAMKDKHIEVIEIPIIQMCYVVSHLYGVLVRCSIMGGDTFDIECAWYYDSDFDLRADKQELYHLAAIPV
jgi:hypothetical protein